VFPRTICGVSCAPAFLIEFSGWRLRPAIETQSLLNFCVPAFLIEFSGWQGADVATSWRVIQGLSAGLVIPDLWQQEAIRALQQEKGVVVQASRSSPRPLMFQRKSSAIKAAPSMMLFKVPIGIGLFPCMGTITWRPFG